jgi:hypothetical protein
MPVELILDWNTSGPRQQSLSGAFVLFLPLDAREALRYAHLERMDVLRRQY